MKVIAKQYSPSQAVGHGLSISKILSVFHYQIGILAVAVLISLLSVIYTVNNTRILHSDLQQILNEEQQLQIEYAQLLLEASTLGAQNRVQRLAQRKLHMQIPNAHSAVIVSE